MASTIKVDEILDSQGNKFDGSQLGNVGKVLQVVNTHYVGGNVSTTSTSMVGTGITCSISPKYSSSKILVLVTANTQHSGSSSQGDVIGVYRNGSSITVHGSSDGYINYDNSSSNYHHTVSISVLDAPSTTSSTNYEIYFRNYSGGTAYIRDWGATTITLMEIGE